MSAGAVLIVGCPGSGKSTLARRLAAEECSGDGRPIIVVDPARVDTFADMHHAANLRELAYRVWQRGEHTAWSPERQEDFDRLFQLIRKLGSVILVVDELRFFASNQSLSLPAVMVTRILRHLNVSIYGVSQSYGDLSRQLTSIASEIIVFRCTAPRDLERLKEDHGLSPEKIAALPQYVPERVKVGF